MKTAFLICVILLFGATANAQSFRALKALNPQVRQGDLLIIQIAPQYMPPATSDPTIFIFGRHYRPNKQGKVLIGIDSKTQPDKYIATFNQNGQRSGWDFEEIEVLQTSFEKTRKSPYTGKPNPRTDNQQDRIDAAYKKYNELDKTTDLADGLGYVYPLSIAVDIGDPFGFIYSNNPYREHRGVDLRAPVGTEVRAVNGGRVILVAKNFHAEGNMVIISHGLGVFSVYMHLSKFKVKEGELVRQGQVIALSGKSGAGANRDPHLHFSIKTLDSYVDPLVFIETFNQYLMP